MKGVITLLSHLLEIIHIPSLGPLHALALDQLVSFQVGG